MLCCSRHQHLLMISMSVSIEKFTVGDVGSFFIHLLVWLLVLTLIWFWYGYSTLNKNIPLRYLKNRFSVGETVWGKYKRCGLTGASLSLGSALWTFIVPPHIQFPLCLLSWGWRCELSAPCFGHHAYHLVHAFLHDRLLWIWNHKLK